MVARGAASAGAVGPAGGAASAGGVAGADWAGGGSPGLRHWPLAGGRCCWLSGGGGPEGWSCANVAPDPTKKLSATAQTAVRTGVIELVFIYSCLITDDGLLHACVSPIGKHC